jgi:hypothetical protein
VRVQGTDATLVPRTALRTDARIVDKGGLAGHDCTGTSAGAPEIATDGACSGPWFDGLGFSVDTIRGEVHAFAADHFYELWIDNRSQAVGVCGAELQEGDDVLLLVAICDVGPAPLYACQIEPVLPLGLSVPSPVAPGARFKVSVVEYAVDGTPTPGRDGCCGTRDLTAPGANIGGIAEGRIFGGAFAPRELRVTVDPDPSGPLAVELRLTRTDHGRCSYFSGRSEHVVRAGHERCRAQHGFWFGVGVGDLEQTSYLLPQRLPRGRYVLDAVAIDRVYDRDDARRRGGDRIVFDGG